MNTNSPITIRRVSNGFLVEPEVQSGMAIPIPDIAVFESQTALYTWLAEHFTPPPYTPAPPLHPYPGNTKNE